MAAWLQEEDQSSTAAAAAERDALRRMRQEPTAAMLALMNGKGGTHAHLVIRSNETCALAIAAKKRVAKSLTLLYHHCSPGLSAGHGTSQGPFDACIDFCVADTVSH